MLLLLFDGNQNAAIRALKTHQKRAHSENGVFTRHKLPKVLRDDTLIEYAHIEGLAHYAGVPSFLLLLFSRVLSEHRDLSEGGHGKRAEALANLDRMAEFCRNIAQYIDSEIKIQNIDAWIDLYKLDIIDELNEGLFAVCFPDTGTIQDVEPWCSILAETAPGYDPKRVADQFRTWCRQEVIAFDGKTIKRDFRRFCRFVVPKTVRK
jgi:hypothetical protein